MRNTSRWHRVVLIAGALSVSVAAWAGYHQTNPDHHVHIIRDNSDRMTTLKARLRVGWRGHEGILDQVKYEIWNTGTLTFKITKVEIVDKNDGDVLWSDSDNTLIRGGKKGSREWRGDFMHRKRIPRRNIKMVVHIRMETKNWKLVWDPDVGGSDSTEVIEA